MNCNKTEIGHVCHIYDFENHACKTYISVYKLIDKEGNFYRSKLAIDVDGAPRAYHPDDINPKQGNHTKALDWLDNLSKDDRHGIQGEDGVGREKGFYVSGTSLANPKYPEKNTLRWVDAEHIPYIVLTGKFPDIDLTKLSKGWGYCVMVIDLKTRASSAAVVGDTGNAVGEGSLRLALNLGLDPTQPPVSRHPPKVGGYDRIDFLHIVFPGTYVEPPWDPKEIARVAGNAFEAWGGMKQVDQCFPKE